MADIAQGWLRICPNHLHDTNTQLFTLSQSIAHARADQQKGTVGLTHKRGSSRYLEEGKPRTRAVLCSKHTQFTAVQQRLPVRKHLLRELSDLQIVEDLDTVFLCSITFQLLFYRSFMRHDATF